MMQSAECPSCGEEITLSTTLQLGQRVNCPHCDAALKVIWLDPPELDWLDSEEEEDFDFDEDFLEEDEFDDDFYDEDEEDEEEF